MVKYKEGVSAYNSMFTSFFININLPSANKIDNRLYHLKQEQTASPKFSNWQRYKLN